MSSNAYPVPPHGHAQGDARFTFGLVHDVAEVLQRHSYPPPATGADWIELQQALFRVLHVGRGPA